MDSVHAQTLAAQSQNKGQTVQHDPEPNESWHILRTSRDSITRHQKANPSPTPSFTAAITHHHTITPSHIPAHTTPP